MRTIYKYTNSNMSGWEFVIVSDDGTDGHYVSGNSASTVENMSRYDLCVVVKTKSQLKEIMERLDWLRKYQYLGRR